MSSSRNENALPEGEGEEGHKLGYSLEIDTKYDVDEEFRKPGYARGPEGCVGTRYGDLPEGGYAGGSVGRARAVTKKGFSAQADGPCGFAGSGSNDDEAYAGGESCIGEAEAHAGPFGVGVQGPGAEGNFRIGNKGLKVDSGANVASGKVQVGPVKVDLPFRKVGAKFDKDEVSIAVEAGPLLGVGVQGPGTRGEVHVRSKGLKMGDGANVASGKVKVGPIKLGAVVGEKSPVYELVMAPLELLSGLLEAPLSAKTDL
ncbi:unnamed protein product, partial [Porites lobata]